MKSWRVTMDAGMATVVVLVDARNEKEAREKAIKYDGRGVLLVEEN